MLFLKIDFSSTEKNIKFSISEMAGTEERHGSTKYCHFKMPLTTYILCIYVLIFNEVNIKYKGTLSDLNVRF